jgi:hypothetical protein
MKVKLTNIEYADCGCPTCGGHDGDYGGTYEEPPGSIEVDIGDMDLNEPDYDELTHLALQPHTIESCDIEVVQSE